MANIQRFVTHLFLGSAFAMVLASCGGGSGGTAVAITDTSLGISTATDSSTAPLAGTDTGQWDGTGGGGGSDGGGGAGDGEFIQFNFNPTTLKLNYTVINSQYGIKGQTGTLSLTPDSTNGGYKIAGSPAVNQGNIYVSKTGQVTGSLPVVIGASTVYMVFNGTRYKDAVTDLTQLAGTYFYGASFRRASNGQSPSTEWGNLRIRTDGTGRICSLAAYSDTCSNGFEIKVAVDNPATPALVKFTTSDYRSLVGYMLAKKNSSGRGVATVDMSFSDQSGNRFTGAVYALQTIVGDSFNPNTYRGSWTIVGTDPLSPRNASTGFIQLQSNTYKQHDTVGGSDCTSTQFNDNGSISNASTYPGMGLASGPGRSAWLIPMSDNFFVAIGADTSGTGGLSLVRRYSVTPIGAGPC